METVEVKAIKANQYLWNDTITFAERCSWQAGPYLANEMRQNKFLEWERVFIAVLEQEIVGFCTLTKTDCISNVDFYPFIGFVFVKEELRGNRLSQLLIKAAMNYAKKIGFDEVFLVSAEKRLYEKYDFQKIADMVDDYGNSQQVFVGKPKLGHSK